MKLSDRHTKCFQDLKTIFCFCLTSGASEEQETGREADELTAGRSIRTNCVSGVTSQIISPVYHKMFSPFAWI